MASKCWTTVPAWSKAFPKKLQAPTCIRGLRLGGTQKAATSLPFILGNARFPTGKCGMPHMQRNESSSFDGGGG
ncbi:MAG: hypothetical protein EBQ92_02240 [Proteobacteria bacterium]|nr:hypothetical protein [Pseudomonadota bacterium]